MGSLTLLHLSAILLPTFAHLRAGPGVSISSQTISIVEAAQLLEINRDTVRRLVKKGELRGYKKTIARTSPFVIDRESVLDYDRRRRAPFEPPAR